MGKVSGIVTAIHSWLSTRRLKRGFATREAFEEWQNNKIQAWIDQSATQVSRYKAIPQGSPLQRFPVLQKQDVMGDFSSFNVAGITSEQGWNAFEGDRTFDGWHVGASTGTSGNRGLYVISDKERYLWLGTMLGKLLPDIWKRRERIAVILPLHTRLYDATNDTKWLKLGFFDLSAGFDDWQEDLEKLDPTIVIAPPRALRWLAQNSSISPKMIYSASEVLDPVDKKCIEQRWEIPIGQIYMATEGLLATSCSHGTLHLAEDVMHFELEPAGHNLVSPIITDFRRTSQIMCRYRLNDLLRMSQKPCTCGSPLRSVSEIVGRQDDAFTLPSGESMKTVTPDILRNSILDADRLIQDFRLIQTSENSVELVLDEGCSRSTEQAALNNLQAQFQRLDLYPKIEIRRKSLTFSAHNKLRRVKNLCRP